jgi:hypothetical protein
MVMLFDVTAEVEGQAALLVSTQLTTSPFTQLALAYVEAFVPTLTPFFFH